MKRLMERCAGILAAGTEAFRRRIARPLLSAADGEDGDIVQTVLIIGLFVVIVVAVVTILNNALVGKAGEIGNAITGQNFTP